MHHCSLLNVAQTAVRVMRNKALNATLEQRSTPIINGTEITLGAFFVALWKRKGLS